MIHWGIIGPGQIARVFCNGLRFTDKGQATAVASRNLQKARQFAADFSIATVHDSYQDLLADPLVDALDDPLVDPLVDHLVNPLVEPWLAIWSILWSTLWPAL